MLPICTDYLLVLRFSIKLRIISSKISPVTLNERIFLDSIGISSLNIKKNLNPNYSNLKEEKEVFNNIFSLNNDPNCRIELKSYYY